MGKTHDQTIFGLSNDLKIFWAGVAVNDQGMISRRFESVVDAMKNCFAFVSDLGNFSMHRQRCADDISTKRLTHGLHAETNAKDWNFGTCFLSTSRQIPASFGVHGPGDKTIASGSESIKASVVVSSLRTTVTSAPRRPRS